MQNELFFWTKFPESDQIIFGQAKADFNSDNKIIIKPFEGKIINYGISNLRIQELNLIDNQFQFLLEENKKQVELDYKNSVEQAIQAIKNNEFQKIVLSRPKYEKLSEGFNLIDYFKKLASAYPKAFVQLIYFKGSHAWIGASPELLIKLNNSNEFESVSLAGTKKSNENIKWTQKEIDEQAFLNQRFIELFKKHSVNKYVIEEPQTLNAGPVEHLFNKVKWRDNQFNLMQWAEKLHPTPAVGSYPYELAHKIIPKFEKYNRELYSGYWGFSGDYNLLFVNLRCAKIFSNEICFYVGAGITADSNSEKEYIETENKLKTLTQWL